MCFLSSPLLGHFSSVIRITYKTPIMQKRSFCERKSRSVEKIFYKLLVRQCMCTTKGKQFLTENRNKKGRAHIIIIIHVLLQLTLKRYYYFARVLFWLSLPQLFWLVSNNNKVHSLWMFLELCKYAIIIILYLFSSEPHNFLLSSIFFPTYIFAKMSGQGKTQLTM